MTIRTFRAAGSALAAVALVVWTWSATAISGFTAQDASQAFHSMPGKGGFEVWIADQSDTRPGFGGQLLIYDGSRLMGKHAAKREADRPARSGRRHRGPLPGRDGQKPRAAAHDPVQQRAHARGPVLRRQRTRRDFRRREAHAAELLRDDCRQHGDAPGARGVSRAGRLVHPRRQPERQAARAHRHQLQDQHLRPQPCRHARPDDVHDAQRAAVRAPGSAAHQLADLSVRRFEQPARVRHAARRRPLRRERQGHADGHRGRVRQVDGERERLRRASRSGGTFTSTPAAAP